MIIKRVSRNHIIINHGSGECEDGDTQLGKRLFVSSDISLERQAFLYYLKKAAVI